MCYCLFFTLGSHTKATVTPEVSVVNTELSEEEKENKVEHPDSTASAEGNNDYNFLKRYSSLDNCFRSHHRRVCF